MACKPCKCKVGMKHYMECVESGRDDRAESIARKARADGCGWAWSDDVIHHHAKPKKRRSKRRSGR